MNELPFIESVRTER